MDGQERAIHLEEKDMPFPMAILTHPDYNESQT